MDLHPRLRPDLALVGAVEAALDDATSFQAKTFPRVAPSLVDVQGLFKTLLGSVMPGVMAGAVVAVVVDNGQWPNGSCCGGTWWLMTVIRFLVS